MVGDRVEVGIACPCCAGMTRSLAVLVRRRAQKEARETVGGRSGCSGRLSVEYGDCLFTTSELAGIAPRLDLSRNFVNVNLISVFSKTFSVNKYLSMSI